MISISQQTHNPFRSRFRLAAFIAIAEILAVGIMYFAFSYALCGFDWNWMGGDPVTVDYKVNGNCLDASAGNSQNQIAVIQLAHQTWNDAGASFNFNYDGTHTHTNASHNGSNEVMWRNASGGGALATTNIWYIGNNIQECDMVFWDSGITWHGGSSAPPGNMFDIQSVATHEFGHYLCLDHSSYAAAVMYYAISSGMMKRDLHSDDIAGIFALYPAPFPPPQNLIATDGFDRQIPLNWSPPVVGNPVRYRIYRSSTGSGGPFNLIDSTAITNYTDYGLINGHTYWYKAKAVYANPTGVSDFSNVDDGTPEAQPVIEASTDTLDFGAVTLNQSRPLDLWIYNNGSLTLDVTDILINIPSLAPYFDISSTAFTVAPDDSFLVIITFTPTQELPYNCAMGIFNNSQQNVVFVRIIAEGTTTGITESLTGPVPHSFQLHQNHPNPFNPQTNIEFSIPQTSNVNLSVFDIMGRNVGTLTNGLLRVGNYRVSWNAEGLPSGIYFSRLQAGSTVLTRKMILLR